MPEFGEKLEQPIVENAQEQAESGPEVFSTNIDELVATGANLDEHLAMVNAQIAEADLEDTERHAWEAHRDELQAYIDKRKVDADTEGGYFDKRENS